MKIFSFLTQKKKYKSLKLSKVFTKKKLQQDYCLKVKHGAGTTRAAAPLDYIYVITWTTWPKFEKYFLWQIMIMHSLHGKTMV